MTDEITVDSYSTEAKANMRGRVVRVRHLMDFIRKNGAHLTKKKLIALYCLKEGISESTAYSYLKTYIDAELVYRYGDHILPEDQYIAKRAGDIERLNELVAAAENGS